MPHPFGLYFLCQLSNGSHQPTPADSVIAIASQGLVDLTIDNSVQECYDSDKEEDSDDDFVVIPHRL